MSPPSPPPRCRCRHWLDVGPRPGGFTEESAQDFILKKFINEFSRIEKNADDLASGSIAKNDAIAADGKPVMTRQRGFQGPDVAFFGAQAFECPLDDTPFGPSVS